MHRLSQRSVECAIVGLPALAIFWWWTSRAGGYFERDWLPGALLMTVVGASSVVAMRAQITLPSRAATVALAAFGGYVAWSFLSILWAGTPADALEGAQRALAYLVFFAIFVLAPWTTRTLLGALLAFIATMAAIATVTLVRLAPGGSLADRFNDGSLLGPVGYNNASVALFTMAAVPAIMLAARRELLTWLRPLLLAAATLLLGLAALGQSRAWLLTLPIVAIAALVLSPDRLKLALFSVPVVGGLALAAAGIVDVGRAGAGLSGAAGEPAMRPLLDGVVTKLTLGTAGTLLVAVGLIALERDPRVRARLALGPDVRRKLSLVLIGATLLAATVGGLVATSGHPLDRLDRSWAQFTAVDSGDTTTGLGSGRYDFWRVALNAWRDHPVLGVGQDNFIELYAVQGRTVEEPRWVHSLPLRLLAHTGVIGAALFLAFLAATGLGARGAWCAVVQPRARAVVGAALIPGIVWLLHGSVDWLWEMPALTVVALAFAGAVLALPRPAAGQDRPVDRGRRAQHAIAASAIAAALVVAVALVPEFLADRDVAVSSHTWRQDLPGAYARLDRASGLNPLSPDAGLTAGRIALSSGDPRRARAGFAEAAERSPRNWYPRFLLGLVATAARDRGEARRQLSAALTRNPRDRLVADALRRVDGGTPVDFNEAQRRLTERRRIQEAQSR
jgi:hypothetical protein